MNIITANIIFCLINFGFALYFYSLPTKPKLTQKLLQERNIGTSLSLIAFYWLGQYTNIFDKQQAQTFLEKVFIYYNFAIIPLTILVYWLNSYLLPRAYACLTILAAYEIINQSLISGISSPYRFIISLVCYLIVIDMTILFSQPWILKKFHSFIIIKPKWCKTLAYSLIIIPIFILLLSIISPQDF